MALRIASRQAPPTEEEVIGYLDSLSNWGRWGAEDRMGALNLITPEKRVRAAGLIKEGISVSCERPFSWGPNPLTNFPHWHFMRSTGEGENPAGANDVVVIGLHEGQTTTQIDAHCHMFLQGKTFNGHPASVVTLKEGAKEGGIDMLGGGIFGRGVLLDVARVLGKEWMEPGEAIFPEDLEAAEKAQGVLVEEGDILLVRTGNYKRLETEGLQQSGSWPGLNAACLPWLHERGVAMLGSDSPNDVSPSGYTRPHRLPIHVVGMWAIGLWILDGCNHEDLTETCQRLSRWEFLLTLNPLKLTGATGSPVNPVAIF